MKKLLVFVTAAAATATFSLVACKSKSAPDNADVPVPVPSGPDIVPPAAPFNATPVAAFADAGDLDKQPPYEQAKVFESNGQIWMARLVLEQKALGEGATKDETELLAKICQEQGDAKCLASCGKKLGRKIGLDAGVRAARIDAGTVAVTGQVHEEPDTDLARARDLILRMQFERARKMLEPKVLDGSASREETRMLRTICDKQNDRMCVALCDAKLK
jgi:hypothetical protein